ALASVQAVVMVVKDGEGVGAAVEQIVAELRASGVRVEVDERTDTPFGRRAVDRELKGIPVRVEVGPRDLADGTVTLVRRIPGTKTSVTVAEVARDVAAALVEDQRALYDEALARREAATVEVSTVEEAASAAANGWARIPWAVLGVEGETMLATQAISVRCLVRADGGVPESADEPDLIAVVGRSY
ncbi:MAG: proline--tRNA ligase, partial [Geodermatophilaceae bacterium]|nr:proline--tRNA ligase [Geodermatophilaceae bacterium]